MIKKDLSKEIQQYYTFSKFVNKYFVVIASFILSVFGVFAFNSNDIKVLDYSQNDILRSFPKTNFIGINPDKLNKDSKYVEAQLIFSPYKITKGSYELGYGIYNIKDKDIYLPSNIKVSKSLLGRTKKSISYFNLLERSLLVSSNFKIKKTNKLSNEEAIKLYNLGCVDSILNNTLFCNYNKNRLLYDLIYKDIDLASSLYIKLFSSLSISNKEKCNLLKQIYSKKYNFTTLKPVVEKFCELEIDDFKLADEFLNKVVKNYNNVFLSKKSDYIEVTKSILANQWFKLIKYKQIPSEDLLNHINFVKDLITSDLIDSQTAEIEFIVLNNIEDKIKLNSDYQKLKSKIKLLKDGEKNIFPGLKSFINNIDKLQDQQINDIVVVKNNFMSVREKIQNIFEEKYSRLFTFIEKVKYDSKKKTAYVKGYIKLSFDNGKVKKQIPVEFEVYDLVGSKFKVKNVKILNSKLQNYIDKTGVDFDGLSFTELYYTLLDKLYAPIVNNDWGDKNNNICKLYESIMKNKLIGKCKNGVVSLDYSSLVKNSNSVNFSIKLKLDNSLNVTNISISPKEVEEKNKIFNLEETIVIPLNIEEKYIKSKLPLPVSKVFNLIPKVYNKLKEKELKKKVNLTKDELKQLQEKVRVYLNTNLNLVRFVKGNLYKLYLSLGRHNFIAYYDKQKNEILHLVMLVDDKKLVIKNVNLRLSEVNKEILNGLSIDPLNYIKTNYPEKYKEYEQIKKSLKK